MSKLIHKIGRCFKKGFNVRRYWAACDRSFQHYFDTKMKQAGDSSNTNFYTKIKPSKGWQIKSASSKGTHFSVVKYNAQVNSGSPALQGQGSSQPLYQAPHQARVE